MKAKLLIDECLSPQLVYLAIAAGHVETTCSLHRGLLGVKDWQLMRYLLDNNYILVTNNAKDFRGIGAGNPGGLYAQQEIHPGLICIVSDSGLSLELQTELFKVALEELEDVPDLVNQALEVLETEDQSLQVIRYDIPLQGP